MTSSDDALLARLNALRSSSVTLSDSSPSNPALSIPKPIQTPESNLSSRLKALRTASESSTTSLPRSSSPPPTPAPISPKGRAPRLSLSSPHHDHAPLSSPKACDVKAVFDDASRQADSLSEDISKTKLIERKADEDLNLAREATAAANAVGHEIKTKWGDEVEIGRKDDKVQKLRGDAAAALERAKKTLGARDDGVPTVDDYETAEGNDEYDQKEKTPVDATDDSNNETGSKRDEDEEADALLAELMDDVALDFEDVSRRGLHQQESPIGSPARLPPPPSLIAPLAPTSPKSRHAPGEEQDGEKDDSEEDDFHKKMKERMSALRSPSPEPACLSLPPPPSTQPVDSLGLPSAPVDQLSKLSVSKTSKEDYICKICYDKATIFCEGCEEDFEEWDTKDDAMFCARCWKEAHLGETADEEERRHEWTVLRRGK